MSCELGWSDCSSDEDVVRDGCETNTGTDNTNCGLCGNDCTTKYNHAVGYCSSSVCQVGACFAGYGDCNNDLVDGCEVELSTNPAHCSGCNYACSTSHGTPTCSASSCSMSSCDGGYTDCTAYYGGIENTARDGCETNTGADVLNCGTCGTVCDDAPAHSAPLCNAGACEHS